MKKLVLLTFALLCFVGFSQTYHGDLTLSTQEQIDNFNYTEIDGSLTIEEAEPNTILNLIGLSELTTINADLIIRSNKSLENLEGLNNL